MERRRRRRLERRRRRVRRAGVVLNVLGGIAALEPRLPRVLLRIHGLASLATGKKSRYVLHRELNPSKLKPPHLRSEAKNKKNHKQTNILRFSTDNSPEIHQGNTQFHRQVNHYEIPPLMIFQHLYRDNSARKTKRKEQKRKVESFDGERLIIIAEKSTTTSKLLCSPPRR